MKQVYGDVQTKAGPAFGAMMILIATISVLMLTGCQTEVKEVRKPIPLKDYSGKAFKGDLSLVRFAKIYFNHMSVGDNVLSGLSQIVPSDTPLTLLKIDEVPSKPEGAFFVHSMQGRNTEPKSKIDAFERYVEKMASWGLDIAFMKLCYVDIDEGTNISELWEYYQNTIKRLSAKYPKIAFAHVTVPLTTKYDGAPWKDFIKGITGLKDDVARANMQRTKFSDRIRNTYPDYLVYDLAGIESTKPDGTMEGFKRYGKFYPSLYPGYTKDGGHLEQEIQQQAARQLVRTLALILSKQGKSL